MERRSPTRPVHPDARVCWFHPHFAFTLIKNQVILDCMRPLVVILILLSSLPAFSCTTFVLTSGHRVYLGKNLDWDWDDGIVLVNQRNVQKRAFVLAENAATWTSKYGSVTFNQFGREMPFGGMIR